MRIIYFFIFICLSEKKGSRVYQGLSRAVDAWVDRSEFGARATRPTESRSALPRAARHVSRPRGVVIGNRRP